MRLRHLLVAVGVSTLLALGACEQQTTNNGGYPGNGPPDVSSGGSGSGGMSPGSMSSGTTRSSNPMR